MNSVRISQPSYKKLLFAALVTLFALFVGSENTLYSANNQLPWTEVDDFEGLSGGINGENGWSTVGNVTVVNDPVDSGNKVLKIDGKNDRAYKDLPLDFEITSAGTLFFRMRRNGNADAFGGASGSGNPTDFDDFELQLGSQSINSGEFTARNGGSFTHGGNFEDNAWYCVWLFADNNNNSYTPYFNVHVEGGQYDEPTEIWNALNFRNGTNSPLQTFFARSGEDDGTLYIDDVYFEVQEGDLSTNLSRPNGDCPSSDEPDPPDPPDPTEGWQSVDNFNNLDNGSINNKNGWSADSSIVVTTDPDDSNDKVLSISGSNNSVYKALPEQIANVTNTGTLFFRMRRSGNVDAFSGLSDDSSPQNFSNFETQFGAQSTHSGDFRMRHGNQFVSGDGEFLEDTWYCVWLYAGNWENDYSVRVLGGQYTESTRLAAGDINVFDFRNGGANALRTFYARSGLATGTLLIDDVYLDAGQANGSKPGGDCPTGSNPTPTSVPPTPTQISPTVTPTPDPPVNNAWQVVDQFESASNGSLHGQNGWVSDGVSVTNDPTGGSNKVISMIGDDRKAFKPFPNNQSIFNNATGTVFFRLYRIGGINGFGGATDASAPSEFGDFEAQFGSQGQLIADQWVIRDGASFRRGSTFTENQWHCIWLVIDQSSDDYEAYVHGGSFNAQARLELSAGGVYDFRNGATGSAISTFFALTGPDAAGTMYMDDIYIHPANKILSSPVDSCQQSSTDADNDGVLDDWEIDNQLDPNNPQDAGEDPDSDGLNNKEEFDSGTDPQDFDSDDDLLPDGFEKKGGLDPLSPNDVNADPDNDSLDNLDENIFNTNPTDPDTDKDGVNDGTEAAQGSNPTDASDQGLPPNAGDVVQIQLTVGDHSGSHSERYNLIVGNISHQAPEFGVVATAVYWFQVGQTYPIRIVHNGSCPNQCYSPLPDYDYTAYVRAVGSGTEIEIDDPDGILGTHGESSPFYARGKVAYLTIKAPDQFAVSGKVVDGSGAPLSGVSISAGGAESATTSSDGRYSLTLPPGPHTLQPSQADSVFEPPTRPINLSADMSGQDFVAMSNGFGIKKVLACAEGHYYFSGAHANYQYKAEVDWEGNTPGTLEFTLNGNTRSVPANQDGGEITYNNFDSYLIFDGLAHENKLSVKAISADGASSSPYEINPIAVKTPLWLTSFSGMSGPTPSGCFNGSWAYTWAVRYPEDPFSGKITPPSWVPIIGGSSYGIEETQAQLKAEAKTDGAGSAELSGQTGFSVGGKSLSGEVSGSGTVKADGTNGLQLTEASFGLAVSGEIEKEISVYSAICGDNSDCILEDAEDLPYIGSAIEAIADLELEGSISPKVSVNANFESGSGKNGQSPDELYWKSGDGYASVEARLALEADIGPVEVEAFGGGEVKGVIQIPADPSYLKSVELQLFYGLELSAWVFETEFSAGHTWSYEPSRIRATETSGQTITTSSGWVATPRTVFETSQPYQHLPLNDLDIQTYAQAEGVTRNIMQDVSPQANPAIAMGGGQPMIVWVEENFEKPFMQGHEIYYSQLVNGNWAAPQTITDDNLLDFDPQLVFTDDGKAVAVWERNKQVQNLDTEFNLDFINQFEIAYAIWDGTNWSDPAQLTSNTILDHEPLLTKGEDGTPLLIWRQNSSGKLIGTQDAPDTFMSSIWSEGQWETPSVILSEAVAVLDITHGRFSANKMKVVFNRDTDNNLSTKQDQQLFETNWNGSNWTSPSLLTNNNLSNQAPKLIYHQDGSSSILWLRGNDLYGYISDQTQSPTEIRANQANGLSDFEVVKDNDGNLAIFWEEHSLENPDTWLIRYDIASKRASQPEQLTDDAALEKKKAIAITSDNEVIMVYNRTELQLVTKTVAPNLTIENVTEFGRSDLVAHVAEIDSFAAPTANGNTIFLPLVQNQ